jgi:hypothetical protein
VKYNFLISSGDRIAQKVLGSSSQKPLSLRVTHMTKFDVYYSFRRATKAVTGGQFNFHPDDARELCKLTEHDLQFLGFGENAKRIRDDFSAGSLAAFGRCAGDFQLSIDPNAERLSKYNQATSAGLAQSRAQ